MDGKRKSWTTRAIEGLLDRVQARSSCLGWESDSARSAEWTGAVGGSFRGESR